jgi:hypothetical protein
MDAIADRLADVLERIAEELDTVTPVVSRWHADDAPPSAGRESADLRVILRRVGGYGVVSNS